MTRFAGRVAQSQAIAVDGFNNERITMLASASNMTMSDWIHRVRTEYTEMPGLILTERQVRRLWNLDAASCDAVLEALITEHFLRRTLTDAFARALAS